ncbi:uncharacterized protein JN550_005234 [Neoarthrinium moseri]|uniref:uncharacterized protein n=1 Tax=Neoarthrinium moseri TaxID=1658444 RepID=UPI001FDB1ACA|nr:uncharacterized protein JN550_005234 [Neoarthrinium moseri]KAI1870306.1 hypothetical protein JN550_005234 [Neoarthrinium moseri]
MLDYGNFERVFGSLSPFPYNRTTIQEADSYRRSLDGALFLDRVLAALGLPKARALYPPKSDANLRSLHHQIISAGSVATLHKLSLLYYLLLDIDDLAPAHHDSKADSFASSAGLPTKYQILMKGLWYLDRQAFALAVEDLAHPTLLPEFADDIITVLVRHASKDGDYTLPLAYWHTVQPVLKSPAAVELLFEALSQSNVSEALRFSRTKPDGIREQLFRRLVIGVLEGTGNDHGADRAEELASLPFDESEEQWFQDCLGSGEGKRVKAARDTLLMRRIAMGEPVPTAGDQGTWGVVMEAFKVGSGGRT